MFLQLCMHSSSTTSSSNIQSCQTILEREGEGEGGGGRHGKREKGERDGNKGEL